jgi:hypothetical protein
MIVKPKFNEENQHFPQVATHAKIKSPPPSRKKLKKNFVDT